LEHQWIARRWLFPNQTVLLHWKTSNIFLQTFLQTPKQQTEEKKGDAVVK
jgi:hypothetical protein